MDQWIPVIAALAGALIGGVISYLATLVTLVKQERSEKRAIILAKLEETHQVVRTIRQQYTETYTDMAQRLLTGTGRREGNSEEPLEIDRLKMLVGFYFPQLTSAVDALESSRQELGATLADCILADGRPRRLREKLHQELEQRCDQVDKKCVELLEAIAATARKQIKL